MSEFAYKDWQEKLDDEQAVQHICIILAAYSEHFPQLRGKGVRPDRRDDNRRAFAALLVEKLKCSKIDFYHRRTDRPLMLDSGLLK